MRRRFAVAADRNGAPARRDPASPNQARGGRLTLAVGAAGLLGAGWGAPIMAQMIGLFDFPFHLAAAEQFASNARITMPHFLLQVLLGTLFSTGWFASVQHAGVMLFTALYAMSAALMCWYIGRDARSIATVTAALVLAVALLLAGPILPSGEPNLTLIGYFPTNVYHNPTMLLAKPLLILALAGAVASLTRSGRPGARELGMLALPIILLGVAKPNYLGCLVPVIVVIAAWNRAAKREVSWARIAAICVPAVLTLGASYALYRSQQLGFEGRVIVAPLRVVGVYQPVDPESIGRYLGASLAFPLVVVALWPRATWHSPAIQFAWGAALMGILFSYLLAEEGPRLDHGNFLWTGQMAVFVLFVATATFVNHQLLPAARRRGTAVRALVTAGVLVLHVESGMRHVVTRVDSLRWLVFWM